MRKLFEGLRSVIGGKRRSSGGRHVQPEAARPESAPPPESPAPAPRIRVRGGERPQSDEDARECAAGLQRLDPLLDIRWEPKGRLVMPGSYSAMGHRVDPIYEGRWEVIRYDTDNLHPDRRHNGRTYTVITRVTELDPSAPVPIMIHEGEFAPVGPWLIEYMGLWDRAQSAFAQAMDRLWRDHEAQERSNDSEMMAATEEGAHKVWSDEVGEAFFGRGFGEGTARARTPDIVVVPK